MGGLFFRYGRVSQKMKFFVVPEDVKLWHFVLSMNIVSGISHVVILLTSFKKEIIVLKVEVVYSGFYNAGDQGGKRLIALTKMSGDLKEGGTFEMFQPFYLSSSSSNDRNGNLKPKSFYPFTKISLEPESCGWIVKAMYNLPKGDSVFYWKVDETGRPILPEIAYKIGDVLYDNHVRILHTTSFPEVRTRLSPSGVNEVLKIDRYNFEKGGNYIDFTILFKDGKVTVSYESTSTSSNKISL